MVHNKSFPLNKLLAFSCERQFVVVMKQGKDNGMHMEKYEKTCDLTCLWSPWTFLWALPFSQNQIASSQIIILCSLFFSSHGHSKYLQCAQPIGSTPIWNKWRLNLEDYDDQNSKLIILIFMNMNIKFGKEKRPKTYKKQNLPKRLNDTITSSFSSIRTSSISMNFSKNDGKPST